MTKTEQATRSGVWELLERFPNPAQGSDQLTHVTIPEFTCLCPKTGQPDFAKLELLYIPDLHCIELKALKLYMGSFREAGVFHEAATNEIFNALRNFAKPLWMRLTARWFVRGGIYTTVFREDVQRDSNTHAAMYIPPDWVYKVHGGRDVSENYR